MKRNKKPSEKQLKEAQKVSKRLTRQALKREPIQRRLKLLSMTNSDRWQLYTSGLSSPQNYIDWSFRYLIATSLQRRVWMGPENQQCFGNMYMTLVGPPGIGKGLPIREVSGMLSHWKLKDAIKLNLASMSTEVKNTLDAAHEEELRKANEVEMQEKNPKTSAIEPLLVPIAADATTYEALVEAVSLSLRRINYLEYSEKAGKEIPKVYSHSSICFCLQELASLLRKRTDDTVNYLLGLYDCPLDYVYNTKTKGKDRVRRGCLNLLAGTTPGFMESIFNDSLVNEGFSSRMFFIYAAKNRGSHFFIKALTQEQRDCRVILLDHIRKLTSLYGPIHIDDETNTFLEEWWRDYSSSYSKWANKSPKLIPYYARKNIHVMKVAMAEHFAESLELSIPLSTFKRAIDILAEEEKNMHLAISMENKNPIAKVCKRVLEVLVTGEKNYVELYTDLFDEIPHKEAIIEALDFLENMTGQIKSNQHKDETTEKLTMYYRLKE